MSEGDEQDWLTAERDKPKKLDCGTLPISRDPHQISPQTHLSRGEALWTDDQPMRPEHKLENYELQDYNPSATVTPDGSFPPLKPAPGLRFVPIEQFDSRV